MASPTLLYISNIEIHKTVFANYEAINIFPMTARESMLLSVRWDGKYIIEPMLYRFDVTWLRRTTVRELLVHVLKEAAPINYASLDVADEILISVVQHVDECSIGGAKRAVKINANRMLDEEVYVVMEDVPTRQFDFVVKQAKVADVDAPGPPVNAFDVLRLASSRVHLLLPPPRATHDNTADDKLFNDFRGWLEENGVGWPRNEVGTQGRQFLNRITTAFFSLTSNMFSQMSDKSNAGTFSILCLLFASILYGD